MFEVGFSVVDAGVQIVGSSGAAADAVRPVEDVATAVPAQQTDGVSTIFNIIKLGIRLLIGGIVLLAVGYFAWGAGLLMRAAGNPQMLEKARNQMIYSGAGAVLAAGAFLGVGTFVDFVSGASGGTIVDVGNVSSVEQGAGTRVELNGFLGIYNGAAVICSEDIVEDDEDIPNTNGEWKYKEGTDSAPDYCAIPTPSS